MAEHYTKNTVQVTKWCAKCKKTTPHGCQGGHVGACYDCIKRLEAQPKLPPKAVQGGLFG